MAQTESVSEAQRPYRAARPSRQMWRRFWRNKLAVGGALVLLVVVFLAIFAEAIAPHDPRDLNYGAALQAPSASHLFGTDDLGRDVLSRVIFGARNSLITGVVSVALALAVGLPVGLVSGYYRGFVDDVIIMRITDALQAVPFLILALALAAVLGPGASRAVIAIGIGFTPSFIRIVRGQTLSQREQDYVQAARAMGASDVRIMFLHVLPNIAGPIIIQTSLATAAAIIAEASLSYLGLGTQPPDPAWGSALRFAQGYLTIAPWMAYWPGFAIFITVLSINLVGDGLRDMLDPRTSQMGKQVL